MGCFSSLKKAFSHEAKEKNQEKPRRATKWFGKKKKKLNPNTSHQENTLPEEDEKHAYSVARAEASVSIEEIAAVKIQTAFRGYTATRALRALKGLVRLRTLIQGDSVTRQTTSTLQLMQTLARVQYQIQERRLRLSENKQAHIRLLQQKHEKDSEKIGDDWDDSTLSKEQIEANMLNKHVAAMKRERALAYAFSHQQKWRSVAKFGHQTFIDPNNTQWGWSWLERWMAAGARPYENPSPISENAVKNPTVKTSAGHALSPNNIPRARNSPPIHRKKATRGSSPSVSLTTTNDEDSRSMFSIQSEQPYNRSRHSFWGSASSPRDSESITSSSHQSQSVPSYMAPTKAAEARARSSSHSPISQRR